MKRRLMIARALVHEPKLLILDEPTAGVDIELRHSMWGFLRQINDAGTTIILTTHYLEEAEHLCRQIGIIDQGRLIENTSMRSLLTKLQVETFVLDLSQPITHVPPELQRTTRLVDNRTLEVDVDREDGLNALYAQLSRAGIRIQSMRNKTNRLEQLFINLIRRNQNEGVQL
jgi:ABC-2 type transport system ATP-binding protein